MAFLWLVAKIHALVVALFFNRPLTDREIRDISDRLSVKWLGRHADAYRTGSRGYPDIQKLRVEKAKELLEGGASVNDAAIQSGYLDAKALTRAFKKYEGITPGSYRDSKK